MKMHRLCSGNHRNLFTTSQGRRDFLQVGAMAGLGITLPQLLKLQAAGLDMPTVETFKPIASSIIHIYLPGGMAQHESWDPKPFAAPDYRGPYSPIKAVTGEYVGETFANIAKILDTYQHRKEEPRYSRRVEMAEIEKNEFNLNISRYISTAVGEAEIDLAATHGALVKMERAIQTATTKHNAFLKELGLPELPSSDSPSSKE